MRWEATAAHWQTSRFPTASSARHSTSMAPASVNLHGNGLNLAKITVAAWVNLSASQASRIFVANYGQSTGTQGWGLGISDSTNNVIKWYTSTAAGSNDTLFSSAPLLNNTWYFVVGTFDGTTKRLYINGVPDTSRVWANTIGYNSTSSSLGYLRFNNAQQLNGQLDEVGVYNRALTDTEIASLAAATATRRWERPQTNTAAILANTAAIVSPVTVTTGGTLAGTGLIAGNLTNSAAVGSGNAPGIITVNGNYSQSASGVFNIDIAGSNPGNPDFDQLVVNGTVTLGDVANAISAGALHVTLSNGYVPPTGTSFKIIANDGASWLRWCSLS